MAGSLEILTVGHSTHSADAFLALLQAHGIQQLADVRTVPKSRHNPQFGSEALAPFLASSGISYRHFPELGGLRKPRYDSVNTAWRHPSFRGYADHMQTETFRRGFDALQAAATMLRTTVMCAEALWWRCHRRLLADALLVHGVRVLHIAANGDPKPHELSEFARPHAGGVIYPGLL